MREIDQAPKNLGVGVEDSRGSSGLGGAGVRLRLFDGQRARLGTEIRASFPAQCSARGALFCWPSGLRSVQSGHQRDSVPARISSPQFCRAGTTSNPALQLTALRAAAERDR